MRSYYESAIRKLDSPRISSRAKEGLADHLMVAYLWEKEDLSDDSLVRLFFEKATSETREYALWFIGRQLEELPKMNIEQQEQELFIKRAMELWKWRLEEADRADSQTRSRFMDELEKFGIWFVSEHLDRAWAISQLVKTLELTEGRMEHGYSVIEALRSYVDENYIDVLKVLSLFVKGDREGWIVMSSRDKIKDILKSIISNHPRHEIKGISNELVNNLTKKGYHEFAEFFIR